MENKILSLSEQLIAIRTDPGNKTELDEALELCLSHLREFTIERFEKDGVGSALVYYQNNKRRKFSIILNGHLDVIPGKESQYSPRRVGDRLYGVGAMDMKSNVACLITVFRDMAKAVSYPLGLQLVTDEELGGFKGTKFQIDKGVRADFAIAGETTNFDIANRARGVLQVVISCSGKTGHGAYPYRGDNAIQKMIVFLRTLNERFPSKYENAAGTTINISSIETENSSFNKIPDDCSVSIDIRYAPEEADTIVKTIRSLLPNKFHMNIVSKEPALCTPDENSYVELLKDAVKTETRKKARLYQAQGTSDARHFQRIHSFGVEFGPIGRGIGTDNEWVDIPSLTTYCKILKTFLAKVDYIKRSKIIDTNSPEVGRIPYQPMA